MMKTEQRETEARRQVRPVGPGFTLLELLVAVAILAMIVLMLVGVFHQSRVAWGVGMRKARLNMEGRAVADFIAQELMQAVADNTLICDIVNNTSEIEFYTLTSPSAANRTARWVRYELVGKEIKRTVTDVDVGGPYPKPLGGSGAKTVAENVTDLKFYTSDGLPHTTDLPAWIDVKVTLTFSETVDKKLRVGSAGPDGRWDTTGDNIWSDE